MSKARRSAHPAGNRGAFPDHQANVSLHAKNIFEDGELAEGSVVKDSLTAAADGKRYKTKLYNLDLILAIGYRVRSPRGVQFRQWVSTHLKEFMALTTWSGSRLRKQDVIIAKNYLTEDEVDTLNRLVVIFLEQAELRAKQQRDLTLDFWRSSVDRMLTSNDQPLLDGPGSVSHEAMKTIAGERYDDFDAKRRNHEALDADAEDLKAIEELEKDLKRRGAKA